MGTSSLLRQIFDVKIFQCLGTREHPMPRNKNVILATGRAIREPEDSNVAFKMKILDLLAEKLPGYVGDFYIEACYKEENDIEESEEMDEDTIEESEENDDSGQGNVVRDDVGNDTGEDGVQALHVRLTSVYLRPAFSSLGAFRSNGISRTTASQSVPRLALTDLLRLLSRQDDCQPRRASSTEPTPKRCKKDVWQNDRQNGDPVTILLQMISNNLKGFVCAPKLTCAAREVALNYYFDWLDNLPNRHPGHIVIMGNPGVGKTTGAWALAKFFAEAGIAKSDKVTELHRDDLVDRCVGGTELRTKRLIEEAEGGVVIFDEVYTLNKPSDNDFGKDALTTIMKHMTLQDGPIFMFLGYRKQMMDFVNMNPGFQRRIKYTVELPDYNSKALACIARKKVEDLGLKLAENIGDLEWYFEEMEPAFLKAHNASAAVSLISFAQVNARKVTLALPYYQRKGIAKTLLKEDLLAAVNKIKSGQFGVFRETAPPILYN